MAGDISDRLDFSQIYVDKLKLGKQIKYGLYDIGFVSSKNNPSELETLREEVCLLMGNFFDLPLEVKMKYYIKESGGQRGYTPNGLGSSSKGKFTDCREHLMIGPRLAYDHPLTEYRPYFYDVNPDIKEVPGLVEAAEDLLDKAEDRDLEFFSGLALGMDLHPSYFSMRLAYGDSSIRLRRYPAIQGKILRINNIEGVEAVVVQFPDGKIVDNLVRASPHRDVDFDATVWAGKAGLIIEKRNGSVVPYITSSGSMVDNSGVMLTYETGGEIPDAKHWVIIVPEESNTNRDAVIKFGHFRPRSPVLPIPRLRNENNLDKYPLTYEGALLWKVLHNRNYCNDEKLAEMLFLVNNKLTPDDVMVGKILDWEERNGKSKLNKYVNSPGEYNRILEL